jgi:hypothetical protein
VFNNSELIQYLNIKTKSANSGSKSRGSFANHYALYVLVEDYITKGFIYEKRGEYNLYEGARFTDLLHRQRQLPFGSKLQNHALNSRLNDEFTKYFPQVNQRPIIRDQTAQRYWINERFLNLCVVVNNKQYNVNIAKVVIEIIDLYIKEKKSSFEKFIEYCHKIASISNQEPQNVITFIESILQPNVDARIFEIVSFSLLKVYYGEKSIFWGWKSDDLQQDLLVLYKTGRTNANDGGIDFVMKPIGRFFQVTETIDVNKYFLDIDKVNRFPITFVVKSIESESHIRRLLELDAKRKYGIDIVVSQYMNSIEEIITIPMMIEILKFVIKEGKVNLVMDEIILQSQVEFDIDEGEDEVSVNEI